MITTRPVVAEKSRVHGSSELCAAHFLFYPLYFQRHLPHHNIPYWQFKLIHILFKCSEIIFPNTLYYRAVKAARVPASFPNFQQGRALPSLFSQNFVWTSNNSHKQNKKFFSSYQEKKFTLDPHAPNVPQSGCIVIMMPRKNLDNPIKNLNSSSSSLHLYNLQRSIYYACNIYIHISHLDNQGK